MSTSGEDANNLIQAVAGATNAWLADRYDLEDAIGFLALERLANAIAFAALAHSYCAMYCSTYEEFGNCARCRPVTGWGWAWDNLNPIGQAKPNRIGYVELEGVVYGEGDTEGGDR